MRILFVSKYNQIRSKVAEAYFNRLNKNPKHQAASAGIFLGDPSPSWLMEMCAAAKVQISMQPHTISVNTLAQYDMVVIVADNVPQTLFTTDNPYVTDVRIWSVELPVNNEPAERKQLFAGIKNHVKELLEEFGQKQKQPQMLDEILKVLYAQANEQARAIWQEMGCRVETYLGVDLENIVLLAGEIGINHSLAKQLWRTGIHDARLLACYLADSQEMTQHEIETWMRQADYWDLTDKIVTEIVLKTDEAMGKIPAWLRERNPYLRRAGWLLVERYCRKSVDAGWDENNFMYYLRYIHTNITKEDNWVKEAMLYTLITIGKRDLSAHTIAYKIALDIWPVSIDYKIAGMHPPNPVEILGNYRAALSGQGWYES